MLMANHPENDSHDWICASECDDATRANILAEAQFILGHASFKNSRRCVTLFRHLVDCFLEDDQESLKERVLGVAVFGRNPDYDSNSDPIVRIAANEIRKRLAQCYEERDNQSLIRIHLIPGSYQLQIERLHPDTSNMGSRVQTALPSSSEENTAEHDSAHIPSRHGSWLKLSRLHVMLIALTLASIVLLLWYLRSSYPASNSTALWSPLLRGDEPILICINDRRDISDSERMRKWAYTAAETIATRRIPDTALSDLHVPATSIVDARVAARVMAIFARQHHDSMIQGSSAVTLDDLRKHSDVLIGAFDNPWSLVLLSQLRYHVMLDPVTQDEWIEDTHYPGKREWSGNGKLQFSDSSADFALITRYNSPDTGKWILAIGGLGMHGTEAAGELISSTTLLNLLPRNIVNSDKNFQIVIRTIVINGHTGPPQIVASYVW